MYVFQINKVLQCPLSNFATWSYGITNDRVYRRNQYVAMGIGYVVKQGYSYEQADVAIRRFYPKSCYPMKFLS